MQSVDRRAACQFVPRHVAPGAEQVWVEQVGRAQVTVLVLCSPKLFLGTVGWPLAFGFGMTSFVLGTSRRGPRHRSWRAPPSKPTSWPEKLGDQEPR